MRRILIGLIMVGIIIALGSWGMADKKPDVKELIQQLGSDDWQKRELAQKKLMEIGEKLIEQYRKAKFTAETQREILKDEMTKLAQTLRQGCQDKDPEIRRRANLIRQHFYRLTQPKIAFVSNRDGNEGIYVMDTDGKNQKKLTENKEDAKLPAWNPDGTKIAFVSNRGGKAGIYIMDADGKNRKMLTDNPQIDWTPAWSPDGTKIAFVSGALGNREIYIMDTAGRNQKKLTRDKADNMLPTWSPDSSKIAFVRARHGKTHTKTDIYVMDANGKNQKRLTKNETEISSSSPVWNSDGSKIAFVRGVYWKIAEIYIMDADGKNQEKLTGEKGINANLLRSPDGTKIACVLQKGLCRGNLQQFGIYVMDIDGKNLQRLTGMLAINYSLTWSPDGDKIAFGEVGKHIRRICMIDTSGEDKRTLIGNEMRNWSPTWSPWVLKEISALFAPLETDKE